MVWAFTLRKLRCGLLAAAVMAGVLAGQVRAEGAAPAGVNALLEALAPLTESPAATQDALKALEAEQQAAQKALGEVEASLVAIRQQIAEAEAKRDALAKRLRAVEAGQKLLSTGIAPAAAPTRSPSEAPSPVPTQPAPAVPAAPAAPSPDATQVANPAPATDPSLTIYTESVRPILEARCLSCHSAEKHRGGLDLSSRAGLLKGGDSGAAFVAGDPAQSLLIKTIRHEAEPHMPLKADKLPEGEIAVLEAWVKQGAPMPEGAAPAPQAKRELVVTDKDREFWAYRPLDDPTPPTVANAGWVQNPVDAFVLATLEEKGLAPAPKADRRTLIRRAYFDLLGLPPTPEEIAQFENDPAPDAWEKLIDRLLANPHYGERWGRHWLDLARYADSDGYEFDKERPNAFPYRDFVIRALNDDMPYDQFVRWQLAGDEYAPDDPQAIAATGFLAAGPFIDNQVTEQNRYDELDDIVSTTASAFLATNVGCARCHDHKYDPVPTRDYYQLLSAFTTVTRRDTVLGTREEARRYADTVKTWDTGVKLAKAELDQYIDEFRLPLRTAKVRALGLSQLDQDLLLAKVDPGNAQQKALLEQHGKAVEVNNDEVRKSLDSKQVGRWDVLARRVQEAEKNKPEAPAMVFAMTDAQREPRESFLLARGNVEAKKEAVQLGFLSVLPGNGDPAFEPGLLRPVEAQTTYRRSAVAEWIVNVDRGAGRLALRVLANRLWHHHFGAGIVRTPNDFGVQGERPTHPALLEWLAQEVQRQGWRLKPMHKLIMTSNAYQMSTAFDEAKAKIDPDNHAWWRRMPLRMEAEVLRDTVLSVSGCLNTTMFGPGIYPAVPEDAIKTGSTPKWPLGVVDGPGTWRRSVYVSIRRSARFPLFEAFDMPDTVISTGKRLATTTPTQGLELLNSPFVNDQARHFSQRLEAEAWQSDEAKVERAYLLTLGRAPQADEMEKSMRFIARQAERYPAPKDQTGSIVPGHDPKERALIDFCQVMLSLNEFAYVQ